MVPSRPVASFELQFRHVFVILFFGSTCIALWQSFPLSSKDLWTHCKYGDWISTQQHLPEREPFCAPADSAQEVTHTQWVSQVALHQVYRLGAWIAGGSELNRLAGGVEMLRLLLALLILARMILLTIAFQRVTRSLFWALVALGVSLLITWTNLIELRPHVVGEIFFAGLLMLVSRPIPSRVAVIIAPPLFVLWANCHASFLGGFGLVALLLAARFLDRARAGLAISDLITRDRRTQRLALILVAGVIATGFLNPHGWGLFDRILTVDGHPNGLALAEWQPLRMEQSFGWHWIFLASMLLTVATHLQSRRGISAGDFLLLFSFAAAGCMEQHMLVWWAIMLPWILAPHWCERWPSPASKADEPGVRRKGKARATLLGAVLGLLVATTPTFSWMRSGRPAPLDQSLDTAPPWALCVQLQSEPSKETIAFPRLHAILRANYEGGRFRGKIMASPSVGDFPLWRGLPVPVCSQLYLFKAKYWTDQEFLLQCQPGWWETFDIQEVNMIILGPDEYRELRRRIEAETGWEVIHRPGPLLDPRHGSFEGWVAVRKKPVAD